MIKINIFKNHKNKWSFYIIWSFGLGLLIFVTLLIVFRKTINGNLVGIIKAYLGICLFTFLLISVLQEVIDGFKEFLSTSFSEKILIILIILSLIAWEINKYLLDPNK